MRDNFQWCYSKGGFEEVLTFTGYASLETVNDQRLLFDCCVQLINSGFFLLNFFHQRGNSVLFSPPIFNYLLNLVFELRILEFKTVNLITLLRNLLVDF